MQKQIGERLPDPKERENTGGDQAKPFQQPDVAGGSAKVLNKGFEDEHGDVGEDKQLDAGSDVELEAYAVSPDCRAGRHQKPSLRGKTGRVKECPGRRANRLSGAIANRVSCGRSETGTRQATRT